MKKIIFSLMVLCLLVPNIMWADGMVVPPEDYYVWETTQKGAIFYESDTKTETLVLSMAFQGNATDFAWIIPTPNKPEVEKGSQDLFTELEELTGTYSYDYEPSVGFGLTADTAAEKEVTVVEEKTVDYYDVAVLTSTDATALATWLNDNGYEYPEKYAYVFNDYINNGWYFVAAKIIPEVAEDYEVTSELNSGTATPLQLTFTANNIVYPLKISQAVSEESVAMTDDYLYEPPSYVDIYLYVFADHTQELTDFSVEYADKIEDDEIEALAVDTQGDAWVTPQKNDYYLTKLYSYYGIAEMDEDLFPKDAEKDETVKAGYQWTGTDTAKLILYTLLFIAIGVVAMIMSPWVLFFAFYTLLFHFVKNTKAKIVFVVLQIIDSVITLCLFGAAVMLCIFAIMELYSAMGTYYYYLEEELTLVAGAIALSVVMLLLFVAKVIVLIIQKKRYKKMKN